MNRVLTTSEDSSELSQFWWLVLLIGLVSAAAGVILVARPSDSLKALAVVVGIFLVLDGITELIVAIGDRDNRTLRVITGVLALIVGIALIRHPFHGVAAIGLLIGILLVAAGGIRLVAAIAGGGRPPMRLLIGGLEIAAGVVIVANPHIGYTALALITGIWLILNGIGMVALAVLIRAA